jgi:hypothetical protein
MKAEKAVEYKKESKNGAPSAKIEEVISAKSAHSRF